MTARVAVVHRGRGTDGSTETEPDLNEHGGSSVNEPVTSAYGSRTGFVGRRSIGRFN